MQKSNNSVRVIIQKKTFKPYGEIFFDRSFDLSVFSSFRCLFSEPKRTWTLLHGSAFSLQNLCKVQHFFSYVLEQDYFLFSLRISLFNLLILKDGECIKSFDEAYCIGCLKIFRIGEVHFVIPFESRLYILFTIFFWTPCFFPLSHVF